MTRATAIWACFCLLIACSKLQKANGCTLCASVKLVSTFREDFSNPLVNFIASGRLGKATIHPNGSGVTEFSVGQVLLKPADWNDQQDLAFDKYLPGGETNPDAITILLGNWQNGRLIPIRAIRLESKSNLSIIRNQILQKPVPDARFLADIFPRLSLPEPELANDAFMEWAKAEDSLVTIAGRTLAPNSLRSLLNNKATPSERLGLFSFLLGCCGNREADSPFFEHTLQSQEPRWRSCRDGLLAGLVLLNPSLGWKWASESLSSLPTRALTERLATLRALKMLHSTGIKEYREVERPEMLAVIEKSLGQKDIADLAIDYLRNWKQVRLEKQVISSFPAKGEAPLLSRSVLQYAIAFRARPACADFLEKVKIEQPDLLREIEEIYGTVP